MSLFDLSTVVSALATHTLSVTRFSADTFNSYGEAATRSTANTFTAVASVQPLANKFAEPSEGPQDSESLQAFSVTQLQPRDRAVISGLGTYEVQETEKWGPAGNYYRSILKRLHASEPRA